LDPIRCCRRATGVALARPRRLELGRRIVDCGEVLGVQATMLGEFPVHSCDEILRDGEWPATGPTRKPRRKPGTFGNCARQAETNGLPRGGWYRADEGQRESSRTSSPPIERSPAKESGSSSTALRQVEVEVETLKADTALPAGRSRRGDVLDQGGLPARRGACSRPARRPDDGVAPRCGSSLNPSNTSCELN